MTNESMIRSKYDPFPTTAARLDRDSVPKRQLIKSKKFGIWKPSEIIFHQVFEDRLKPQLEEKLVILHCTSLFQTKEEAVTVDLLPLIVTMTAEGNGDRSAHELFLVPALGVIADISLSYNPVPFGLIGEDILNLAMDQFFKRIERLKQTISALLVHISASAPDSSVI